MELRTAVVVALAISITVVAGCGGGPIPTYPVRGKVTKADGAPLADARVIFQMEGAVAAVDAVSPRGYTDKDGSYKLGTFEIADGAPAGKYQVTVIPRLPPANRDAGIKAQSPIDTKYLDFQASGLRFEVTTDASKNEYNFTVEPNKNL